MVGAAAFAGATACSASHEEARPVSEASAWEHPAELVGRWVRLRADSSWGDTLEYLPNGQVRGSAGHAVPPGARWGTRAGPLKSREFCAGDEQNAYCQTYRLAGSIMILGGGPPGPTYFRRAP
jgi:hypothetical protein